MTAAKEASMQLTTSPEVLCEVEPQIYRAGVPVAIKHGKLSSGLVYEEFRGGKYFRFILAGSYSNLPNACCRIFQVISDGKLPLRDDFNIENYVNDPRTTPEDQLITEILFSST
jgi:DNA gyrase inhibitor GyrI